MTTTYCVALKTAEGYIVQECDHTGKPTSEVALNVKHEKFEEQFEPVKRQSNKKKEENINVRQ